MAPRLAKLLGVTANVEKQESVFQALQDLGPEMVNALPVLKDLAKSRSRRSRYAAACALGPLATEGAVAVPELMSLLLDKDTDVTRAAAKSLIEVGVANSACLAPVIPTLLELVGRPGRRAEVVRERAKYVLSYFGEHLADSVPTLRQYLSSPDCFVRSDSVDLLGCLR